MLRLTTFGGLALWHGDMLLRSHTPRQRLLPMLALIAAEGRRGLSRDRVSALLWPESDAEHARHSLEEVVSQARKLGRVAGEADLFARGIASLVLDPAAITVDVWDFDAAIKNSELQRAAEICGGRRFAADVAVAASAAAEDRLAAIGERYAREYVQALRSLAARAAAVGNVDAAIRWNQRILDAEPGDREAALALIDTLDTKGERARAIVAAERYQTWLADLRLPADAEIDARIRRLRIERVAHVQTDVARQPATTSFTPPMAVDHAKRIRARIDAAIAPRYAITGRGMRGSFVTSFPVRRLEPPGASAELHVIHHEITARVDEAHFVDTMRRAAALDHANVHPIAESAVCDDVLYFVTPPRSPASLRTRLREDGQLPIAEVIALARDVSAALAAAHASGVTHGDLRPKHALIAPDGAAVIGFFGVVDALLGVRGIDLGTSFVVSIGEPAYQSPEQLRREVVASPRADVYAFGAIVFEMLAGEPPFAPRGAPIDLGRKLTEPPPDLRPRRSRTPEALEAIVLQCLSPVPADRFASGAELARALAGVSPA